MKSSRSMVLSVPNDPALLEEFGVIAIRHTHLDVALKMTIRSLAGLEVREARDALRYTGSAELRKRIKILAKKRLGEGPDLLKLEALLQRCQSVTLRRNEVVHGLIAEALDSGIPEMETKDYGWGPLPSVAEAQALAAEIEVLTNELNSTRLRGYLAEALARPRNKV